MKNIATLFLTVLFSFSMFANVSLSEKDALLKLYKSTNGSQWISTNGIYHCRYLLGMVLSCKMKKWFR